MIHGTGEHALARGFDQAPAIRPLEPIGGPTYERLDPVWPENLASVRSLAPTIRGFSNWRCVTRSERSLATCYRDSFEADCRHARNDIVYVRDFVSSGRIRAGSPRPEQASRQTTWDTV
jgi:hypothetical protein